MMVVIGRLGCFFCSYHNVTDWLFPSSLVFPSCLICVKFEQNGATAADK